MYRGEEPGDGAAPLHAQLDSISQAGATEAGRESQLQGVSLRTRHPQSPPSLPELGQTSELQQAASPGFTAPKTHTHTDRIGEREK